MQVQDFLAKSRVRYVYHFTDVANLPLIRVHGLLPYDDLLSRGIIPPKPGGDEQSRQSDECRGLGAYVHLCFKNEHPMEYVACRDGRIGPTRFLEVSPAVLLRPGVMGCCELANRNGARLLTLSEALDEMDLDILFNLEMDFSDCLKRQRWNEARKAEILVPGGIPAAFIANLS